MRGNKEVLKQLNAALSSELTAIIQYMVQSEMCSNWGYGRLGSEIKKQAIEEMHHAEGLIERIIFLDGTPTVDIALKPKIAPNVKGHLEDNLTDEKDAVRQYNEAVKVCAAQGDNGTRELFEGMVKDEEEHTDHLEQQLHSIKEMGIENWLAEQLEK